MDSNSIFSKTAKGLREVSGESSDLTRPLRAILKEIDGKRIFSSLQEKLRKFSEAELKQMLERLEAEGYIRDTTQVIHNELQSSYRSPAKQEMQGSSGDLDFTVMAAKQADGAKASQEMHREAEAKTIPEAELDFTPNMAKQATEAKARREAEEKLRREAEAKARREAEERERKEAEDRARREAEETARREAEERAHQEAEAKARREAEEKLRREAEAKARREAEERERKEAEDRARREAEEKARREAEERARQEAEAKARREAEEKLRREAEAKARREAEERARKEAEDRARQEAEEKARREAEERARQEAEAEARREEEARIRKEAEAELLLEAKQNAKREARKQTEREAEVKAESAAMRAASRVQVNWGKLITLISLSLVAIILGTIRFVPFNGRIPGLEKIASERFQQPVKIDSLHLSLFPQPHWRLGGVSVGSEGQIKVPQVKAVIDLGGIFDKGLTYKSIEFESPRLKEESTGWLLFGRPLGQAVKIAHIRFNNATLESESIDLPRFDAKTDIGADGNWQKTVLEFSQRDIYVELHPGIDGVQFEINANRFQPPFGGSLQLDDFSAKGTFSRGDMTITEFEGRNSGGSFRGNASLKWARGWSLAGSVNVKQIDSRILAPALLSGGRVDGKATYAMKAKDARSLFAVPHLEGSFVVSQGELLGVDLMHLLQNAANSGKTGFRELSGSFARNGGVTQLRQLRLSAGIISASGSAELNANDVVRGRFAATYRFDNQQTHVNFGLSGTVSAPQFSR